jgi:DNA-binding FadR family transcriptional regulator
MKGIRLSSAPAVTARKPRYVELADELRAGIIDGRFAQADGFPTEQALCDAYGVSRFTIREALRRLQSEGLIQRRRGSGTVVQPAAGARRCAPPAAVERRRDPAICPRHPLHLREAGRSAAAAPPCRADRHDASAAWFHFRGLRTRAGDDAPIALTDVYLHQELRAAAEGLRTGEGRSSSRSRCCPEFRSRA